MPAILASRFHQIDAAPAPIPERKTFAAPILWFVQCKIKKKRIMYNLRLRLRYSVQRGITSKKYLFFILVADKLHWTFKLYDKDNSGEIGKLNIFIRIILV
jgi:hypothetical protein